MNVLIPVKLSLLKSVRWNSIAYESVWNHMDECASSRETVSMVKGQRRQGRALAHKALHPHEYPFLFLTHSIEFFLTCLDTCLLFDRILRY